MTILTKETTPRTSEPLIAIIDSDPLSFVTRINLRYQIGGAKVLLYSNGEQLFEDMEKIGLRFDICLIKDRINYPWLPLNSPFDTGAKIAKHLITLDPITKIIGISQKRDKEIQQEFEEAQVDAYVAEDDGNIPLTNSIKSFLPH